MMITTMVVNERMMAMMMRMGQNNAVIGELT